MKQSIQFALVLWTSLCCLVTTLQTQAQVVPDVTLPNNSNVTTQDGNTSVITGGTVAGSNLFHSFREFSVPTGGTAYFNNALEIQNIISRVTGSSISNIDGLLKANGSANLFLLNPNGIIFGPGAELNIGGSFVGSTASAVKFPDGNHFSATAPQTTSLLTVSVPLGLQFGPTAGSIVNQSRSTNVSGEPVGLQVQLGKTLALVGGNVRLEGATMLAPGGRVELGGVSGAGTVEFVDSGNLRLSFPDSIAFADVELTNGTFVGVAALGSGSIAINARNINVLRGSYLFAGIDYGLGSKSAVAGDVTLNATGTIALKQSSNIINEVSPNATGNSGNIDIKAESLDFENAFLSVGTFGAGNGGTININAGDTVDLKNTSLVANTYGVGNGGTININARNTVSFDRSYVDSNVEREAVGNGGNINITTGSLYVTNGAKLAASTFFGKGNAGNVIINARGSVSFDKSDAFTVNPSSVGNGGNIEISADSLSLTNDATLRVATGGQGTSGNIKIRARELSLSSNAAIIADVEPNGLGGGNIDLAVEGSILLSGGQTISLAGTGEWTRITLGVLPGGIGSGGNLTINANSLVLTDGSLIKASTQGQGSAGNITVNARIVDISGSLPTSGLPSGMFTSTTTNSNAGDITINSDRFRIGNGAILSARTSGGGRGGNITVNVNSFTAVDGGQLVTTASGQGQAGNIFVNALERVSVSGTDQNYNTRMNKIAANERRIGPTLSALLANNITETGSESGLFVNTQKGIGTAGNLEVDARSISLDNSGRLIAESASGNGGNINLNFSDLLLLRRGSQISASAGTDGALGDGGNITINASNGFIVAVPRENSDITANAFTGSGGQIRINTSGLYGIEQRPRTTSLSDITASSEQGIAGTIAINLPEIEQNLPLLEELPIVDPSNQIAQNPCTRGEGSEFIITGRGGLPPSPNEDQTPAATQVGLVESALAVGTQRQGQRASSSTNSIQNSTLSQIESPIVEAQGWVFNDKGEIVLIANNSTVSTLQRFSRNLDGCSALRRNTKAQGYRHFSERY